MTAAHPMASKCQARNRRGGSCGEWAQPGQRVCHLHGGRSPQALAKAEDRMRDLVHPALSALERQINNDEFAATKYVLDWAGFRVTDAPSGGLPDAPVHVTVVFDHANETPRSLPDAS